MDSSLQSANLTADELDASLAVSQHAEGGEEEEHHVHLPNPSLWPIILSGAILVTVVGLLFIPDDPWLTIIGAPFILVGIMGWALEDPMAPRKEKFVTYRNVISSKFTIGQEVVDKDGQWVGTVQARFPRHILVERGGLFVTAYYVPQSLAQDNSKDNLVHLTVSEAELVAMDATRLPADLYEESPEPGVPQVKGVPLFARGPLSPAETGHYNYGPYFPGVNTDASGSYHHEEVRPVPQKYVGERRKLYATAKALPPRVVSPD
ncbi:MAG: hypothetical protein JOZ18_01080 [Chloroflexi bacterium]|nr:hypothetical protein [Chloroflexota bacterium]